MEPPRFPVRVKEKALGPLELAHADYHDVLVATGFANADWPEHMNASVGPR